MDAAGWIAIGLGVLLSLYLLQNDFRATRADSAHAGRKFGPELHVVAGILTGGGSGLLLGAWAGLGIGVGYTIAAFALALILYRA